MAGRNRSTRRLTKIRYAMKSSQASPPEILRVTGAQSCSSIQTGDEVEFVTLLRFDSIDAVKEFAGADQAKPVIYPKAEALLTRMDERSQHYRIAV